MKHDWEWRSFETCLEKVIYTKKLQSSDYLSEGKYPIVSQEEGLISGYWDNDDDVFRITKPIVIFGDHTRVLKYIDFNFVLGADGVKILQPIDDIRAKFLYYYLKWFNVPSLGYSRHYKLLKECSVPVPALAVQERIVGELDKVREVIEKKKEQLKELDNLAQSIFYDMFGDPVENPFRYRVSQIGNECVLKSGNSDAAKYGSGDLPYIKVGDMNIAGNENYITTSSTFVNRDKNLKGIFPIGSVIFPKRGGAILTNKKRMCATEICCDLNTMGVIPNGNVHPEYLFAFFKQLDLGKLCNGAAIPQINNTDISPLKFLLPPLSLQQSFAQKIEAIEKQKELITASIKEAQLLFDSRMEYWFGE